MKVWNLISKMISVRHSWYHPEWKIVCHHVFATSNTPLSSPESTPSDLSALYRSMQMRIALCMQRQSHDGWCNVVTMRCPDRLGNITFLQFDTFASLKMWSPMGFSFWLRNVDVSSHSVLSVYQAFSTKSVFGCIIRNITFLTSLSE